MKKKLPMWLDAPLFVWLFEYADQDDAVGTGAYVSWNEERPWKRLLLFDFRSASQVKATALL